jgi:hypothetical protein
MAAAVRSIAAATSRATGGATGPGETTVAEDEVEDSTGEGSSTGGSLESPAAGSIFMLQNVRGEHIHLWMMCRGLLARHVLSWAGT